MDKYFYRQNSEKDQQYTLFLSKQFYKKKSLDFRKKIKNKLRTKPGLLSHRT